MGTVSPWHVSKHFSEYVRLKKCSQPLRIVRTLMLFKAIFVAVSMYWQSRSFFFFNVLFIIRNFTYEYNVFIFCSYLDLGSKIWVLFSWSQFVYSEPYRLTINVGFIILKLFWNYILTHIITKTKMLFLFSLIKLVSDFHWAVCSVMPTFCSGFP